MADVSLVSSDSKLPSGDKKSAFVEATTTQSKLTLNPHRQYTCFHTGLDTSAAAKTVPIFFSETSGFTEDLSESTDRWLLLNNGSVIIGPGVTTLYAGIRTGSDDPVFNIVAGPHFQGQW